MMAFAGMISLLQSSWPSFIFLYVCEIFMKTRYQILLFCMYSMSSEWKILLLCKKREPMARKFSWILGNMTSDHDEFLPVPLLTFSCPTSSPYFNHHFPSHPSLTVHYPLFFQPDDESSCSDEYTEGDTEAELSKLSVEDVSEPRPSALRNVTVVDNQPVKEVVDENTNVRH